jgi:hypothetical protein
MRAMFLPRNHGPESRCRGPLAEICHQIVMNRNPAAFMVETAIPFH